MSQFISFKAENLEAHYTTNPKVVRSHGTVPTPSQQTVKIRNYNDEVGAQIKQINQDIYQSFKEEKNKDKKTFLKIFGGIVATVLSIQLIRKLFKI